MPTFEQMKMNLAHKVLLIATLSACCAGCSKSTLQVGAYPARPLGGYPDTDCDGLTDVEEVKLGTEWLDADTDDDGFHDGDEVLRFRTDPLDEDSHPTKE